MKPPQKTVKIDANLMKRLDKFMKTKWAKDEGYHSKAQFATEAIRDKLPEFEMSAILQKVYDNFIYNIKDHKKKGIDDFHQYLNFLESKSE